MSDTEDELSICVDDEEEEEEEEEEPESSMVHSIVRKAAGILESSGPHEDNDSEIDELDPDFIGVGNEDDDDADDVVDVDEDDDDGNSPFDLQQQQGGAKPKKVVVTAEQIVDDEEDEDDDVNYLQKFNSEINKNYIAESHPESLVNNYDEISVLTKIIRDSSNIIIDDLHKTVPYLTKYEKARIIGQRAKQINAGATPFVKVPANVIDGYLIAEMELTEKRIPFIIRRPLPGGACEYWNVKDLEVLHF